MSDSECYSYWFGGCSNAWYSWGRWVLLGIAIAVALISLITVRWYSMVQVRRGHRAPTGTGWMVPPSYYQSQQQQYGDSAAPPYNPNVGEFDAGYYDHSGNFIAKPAAVHSQAPADEESAYHGYESSTQHNVPGNAPNSNQTVDYSAYGPPEGPPPSSLHASGNGSNDAGPASSIGAAASAYYPPPPGAPPQAARKN